MNIYRRKQRWKLILLGVAAAIVAASLWYTDTIVKKIAVEERQKVSLWADAIQKRANLVNYMETFFEKIKDEERERVELWAEATRRILVAESDEELTFYVNIIESNTNIPVLHVDDQDNIITGRNLDSEFENAEVFEGEVKQAFSEHSPIPIKYNGNIEYLYYRDSQLFTELREVLENLIESFIDEIVVGTANIPVIVTDSTQTQIIAYGNVNDFNPGDSQDVENTIDDMKGQNPPISIELPTHGTCHVFYKNSFLLTQLKYYPLAQFGVIGMFLFVAYILFSMARNAEQNQVWVGMSKETAHQLGTPLSSLMAWMELLKLKGIDEDTVKEVEKDIKRLENITERFSKVGSPPQLLQSDIVNIVNKAIEYLKPRLSKNTQFSINVTPGNKSIEVPVNPNLFEWVVENICKNAVDAMGGNGKISIDIIEQKKHVVVDITDSGKGISKYKFNELFKPGYTSKKRGWGLGLSLSKRIIENYHKGRLFVKSSQINKGTTFRIMLKK